VRVNAGGDPDRDDFGLPPIDIVIPDDARELDRDVQAYQRELRALRRKRRVSRLRGPLTRDGMVLPLLAGCLMLALLTSTLLIMFAADQTGAPDLPRSTATQSQPKNTPTTQPAAGQLNGLLPAATVKISGKAVALRTVTAAMASVLTLVPVDCKCASELRQLTSEAARADVLVFLVGTPAAAPQLGGLAAAAGQPSSRLTVAEDTDNVLGRTYGQEGLTAILVRRDGTVASVIHGLPQQKKLDTGLQEIASVQPAGH
jgi:hypothetical protein